MKKYFTPKTLITGLLVLFIFSAPFSAQAITILTMKQYNSLSEMYLSIINQVPLLMKQLESIQSSLSKNDKVTHSTLFNTDPAQSRARQVENLANQFKDPSLPTANTELKNWVDKALTQAGINPNDAQRAEDYLSSLQGDEQGAVGPSAGGGLPYSQVSDARNWASLGADSSPAQPGTTGYFDMNEELRKICPEGSVEKNRNVSWENGVKWKINQGDKYQIYDLCSQKKFNMYRASASDTSKHWDSRPFDQESWSIFKSIAATNGSFVAHSAIVIVDKGGQRECYAAGYHTTLHGDKNGGHVCTYPSAQSRSHTSGTGHIAFVGDISDGGKIEGVRGKALLYGCERKKAHY